MPPLETDPPETACAEPPVVRLTSGAENRWQVFGEVVLCSGYPTQLAVGSALRAVGVSPLTSEGSLSARFVFALSLADTALLLSLIVWLLLRSGERPLVVFFGGRPVIREAWAGLVSVPFVVTLVVVVTLAIQRLAPGLHNVSENPLEGLLGSQTGLLAFLFVVIVAGGVREELQRSFLLHRFREHLGGAATGLFATSVAFGLGHTLQGWDSALITGLLGATWGVIYLSRGSAVATIMSHSVFNASQLLRAFYRL